MSFCPASFPPKAHCPFFSWPGGGNPIHFSRITLYPVLLPLIPVSPRTFFLPRPKHNHTLSNLKLKYPGRRINPKGICRLASRGFSQVAFGISYRKVLRFRILGVEEEQWENDGKKQGQSKG
ncbi:hypothetical protein CTI12_AA083990 [Artemisia annua]|uniref:Uncharacterized protein n=1 Tax=Artemisia annua TaxID=35608 RepID=A0A2U1Q244_ARTAN|nr:hypothetical protein CTI12_AA083990 [Artemisia annua]